MDVITMGDLDIAGLGVLRQSACQVGRRLTTQGVFQTFRYHTETIRLARGNR